MSNTGREDMFESNVEFTFMLFHSQFRCLFRCHVSGNLISAQIEIMKEQRACSLEALFPGKTGKDFKIYEEFMKACWIKKETLFLQITHYYEFIVLQTK